MLILYSLGLLLALLVSAPWWLLRMVTSGKYREGLAERLGRVPPRICPSLAAGNRIWVHAVSVGEVLAASRLIEELEARLAAIGPDGHRQTWRVMVSTTTRTGQKLARERFGAERVFYFPLDFGWAVRAWLRAVRPSMLVLAETEFWPRILAECRRAAIPVAVVNARISDRSWPRYRRLAPLWRRILRGVSVALAQSELDADRLRTLGINQVQVAGNLKFDVRVTQLAAITTLLHEHLPPGAPVLVCGSTLAGEEEMLLDALPRETIMILAPRHPERFGEVANLLERRAVRWERRSVWAAAPDRIEPGTVLLLDSIGELASVYSLATAAFIGGSLVPAGGHNPLEAAQFGVPVALGTSYENFRGIVEKLRERHALLIAKRGELPRVLAELLSGSAEARAMGARAQQVFASEAGATERSVQALVEVLATRKPEAFPAETRR